MSVQKIGERLIVLLSLLWPVTASGWREATTRTRFFADAEVVAKDICSRLGRRLQKLRHNRGWSQAYLAELSRVGRVHISELENGRREAGLRVLEILAESFEISLSDLFSGL